MFVPPDITNESKRGSLRQLLPHFAH